MGTLTLTSVTRSDSGETISDYGATDFAIWTGDNFSATPEGRKSGGGSVIGCTYIGAGGSGKWTGLARTLSWSGATDDTYVDPTGSSSSCALTFSAATGTPGSGYDITFPASTTPQRAHIWVTHISCEGRLTLSLSDASASTVTDDSSFDSVSYGVTYNAHIVIDYAANSGSQTLTARWEFITNYGDSGIGISAASLEPAAVPSLSKPLLRPIEGVGSQQQYFYGG